MGDANFTKIPKFLRRLYRETTDPKTEDIAWSDDGERVQIVNREEFVKNTLPRLSRAKEYSGFVRQLNFYGFLKVRGDDEPDEYYNKFFRRDEPSLIGLIKRVKKYTKVDAQLQLPSLENSVRYLSDANYRLSNEVAELRDRVEKQERAINGLLDIFGRVFRNGLQNYNYDGKLKTQQPETNILPANDIVPIDDASGFRSLILKKKTENEDKKKEEDIFSDMNNIFF